MHSNLQSGPIDVHAHVVPGDFPPAPEAGETRWACMVCGQAGHRTVTFGDRPFRLLDDRSWSTKRRVEDMDRDGVAAQVLSPMPELLSYWLGPQSARVMGDHVNGAIANMVAEFPTRFAGLGMVPMQDQAEAVRALLRLKREFGLTGVEVGSNVNGIPIGDRRFEPIFEAAADLSLAVFVHALHPLATADLTEPQAIGPLAGFPLDIGLAAASMLMSGLLTRLPKLRVGFSHGGGALGSILGRLDQGWAMTDGFSGAAHQKPSVQTREMFFDSNVYEQAYLRYLTTEMAPEHVFLRTDYPYDIMQTEPIRFLKTISDIDPGSASIFSRAALLFLG